MNSNSTPPFEETYSTLFGDLMKKDIDDDHELADDHHHSCTKSTVIDLDHHHDEANYDHDDQSQLPIIDLNRLRISPNGSGSLALMSSDDDDDRKECVREICKAAKEWGFFQVVNHGVSRDLLEKVKQEQERLFREPFHSKANNYPSSIKGCYRWGTPTARSISQFSWSEAFHVPLSHISGISLLMNTPSSAVDEYAAIVSKLAQTIAAILADNLGEKCDFFVENCRPASCFLRLNRYPPCPYFSQVHGLVPHTDSDFLTILYQNSLGGLQLVKDEAWISVKPNPDALIVNIGDLFEAWSNGVYKSIKHRVLTNGEKERLSVAYFLCPSHDTPIQSCGGSCSSSSDENEYPNYLYRKFTFGEYRHSVQEDVESTGSKNGLLRFLASSSSS